MEDTASHLSCICRPGSVSAGETSRPMHFAGFPALSAHNNQEMGRQGRGGGVSESSFSSGFSSSFDSLGDGDDADDSLITSDLMWDDDDEDDSLQDTACSSAAGPNKVGNKELSLVTSMSDMYMKLMATMDAKEMNTTQLAKYFLDARSRQQATAGAVQEVISGGNSNEKQLYECNNDLRKKGLCLVPISMLIDYLG